MHGLSIVIPCHVFDGNAEDTLVSVLQYRPHNCEVIVVTTGKYSDPYDLAGEVTFIDEPPDATFVQLANRGFREARHKVVHILHPGILAVDGWTGFAMRHFDDMSISSLSPALVQHAADERALLLGVGYWSSGVRRVVGRGVRLSGPRAGRAHILGPSFAAGFYRKDVVLALGGFDEGLDPSCADVELALAMKGMRTRAVAEPRCRVVGGALPILPKLNFRAACQLERLYRRYPPSSAVSRLLHAVIATWDIVSCFPHPRLLARLLGRLTARCEMGIGKRQEQRMRLAAAQLTGSKEAAQPVCIRVDFAQTRTPSRSATSSGRRAA